MFCEGKITTFFRKPSIICQKKVFTFDSPKVMGILNITEDSFFDGGKYTKLEQSLVRAEEIINEGADIIDIGACSTRPGSTLTDAKEEISKIIPVLKAIRKRFPQIIISIDTVWSEVSRAAIAEGADIINDISGGGFDKQMLKTIGELGVPYILTHNDKLEKISQYFSKRIDALYEYGAKDIILDLGYGFNKTLEENYKLLAQQKEFEIYNLPILIGISRKSMIYKPLEINPEQALNGTTFLHAFALQNGADILRVHDVAVAKQCIKLFQLYIKHFQQ